MTIGPKSPMFIPFHPHAEPPRDRDSPLAQRERRKPEITPVAKAEGEGTQRDRSGGSMQRLIEEGERMRVQFGLD